MLTLAELMTPEGAAAIADRLRANLLAAGLPTGSWAPTPAGLENLRIEAAAGVIQALIAKRVAAIAKGRLLSTASDLAIADGGDGPWLSYLGQEVYRLERKAASKTIKWIALYSTAGDAQPQFDFEPGDLTVRSPATGNQYVSVDGGHFSGANTGPAFSHAGDALVLRFEAEAPGARYADPAKTITEMVTAKAGVQCLNIRPVMFEPAILIGSSGGAISAAFTSPSGLLGPLPTYSSVIVRIDAEGNVGGGAWSWQTPGGAWTPGGPMASTTFLPGGTTVSMVDGAASPSFRAGDLFVMYVGSDVDSQGADQEAEGAFARMCTARYTQISDVPLAGAVELLARAASPEVARVFVDADQDTPALVVMTVASAVGPASPAALRAVQAFVAPRLKGYQGVPAGAASISPAERAVAVSARSFDVNAGGVAYAPAAIIEAAKVAASAAWVTYLGQVAIGGGGLDVELARLVQIIMDAGADDIDGANLNGGTDDVPIPTGFVPTIPEGSSLAVSITWVPT
ncbi:MAG: hypothetical protein V4537_14465 [Pseudomonadota bacterium]